MSPLFTAPRARPVTYEQSPAIADEFNKVTQLNTQKSKLTSVINKAKRVIAEQVPVSKLFTPIASAADASKKFVFPGVQTIRWTLARDITEQYGLQSFTMLPWYTKAIAITIVGKAYLGAFATDLTAVSGLVNTALQAKSIIEYIRDEMREVDSRLNGVGITSTNTNSSKANVALLSSLSVGVDGEPGSIKVLGFIKSFDVDEDVATPYVQKYTLTYLGVDMGWYTSARAQNRFLLDNYKYPSPIARQSKPKTK